MLEVKNINIAFKYSVIENGELCINPYEITLLTGKSGTGKTSLLNILGLLDRQSQYMYLFGDETISDSEMDDFSRFNVSYVFQDYNLIEDLSIQDNFKVMFNVVGTKFDNKKMRELLEEVSIDPSKIKSKVKSLSGGEKQRAAIALALVKNPKLLLLDEPTANLDEENEKQVISILQSLKEKGMMIVVATHHPQVYHAEHIYKIKDHQVIDDYHENHNKQVELLTQKGKKFNIFSYAIGHISSHIVMYGILLLVIVGSLYNVTEYYMSAHTSNMALQKFGDAISENEILLINNQDLIVEEDGWYYRSFSKGIDEKVIETVKKIAHVEKVYPYYKMSVGFGCDVDGNEREYSNDEELNNFTCQGKTINVLKNMGDYLSITSCDPQSKELECYKVDKNVTNGIFISDRFAKELGINELDNTEIRFTMPIIMGYYHTEGYTTDKDGKPATEIVTIYPHIMLYKEMTYKVKGIYEMSSNTSQFYDENTETDLYVDYHEMERLHNEAVSDSNIMEMYKKYIDYALLKDHNSQYSLKTSLYVLKIDDKSQIESIKKEIESLDFDVNVKTKSNELDKVSSTMNEIYRELLILPVIILCVIDVMIVILYIYTLHQRKKELSLLRANGIKNSFVLPFIDMAVILGISIPITVALNIINNQMTGGYFIYDLSCIIMNVLAVGVLLVLCFIVNKIYYRKTDIIQELRSK